MLNSFTVDPTAQFTQSSYTVGEGEGQLEVCTAIDLELEVTVPVAVSSQGNTAHCKYIHYHISGKLARG